MAVRNFWMDAYVDGRQTWVATGPRPKDGGMSINVFQRDEGGIEEALTVRCYAYGNKLTTVVCAKVPCLEGYEMKEVARYVTER